MLIKFKEKPYGIAYIKEGDTEEFKWTKPQISAHGEEKKKSNTVIY